eukprot:3164051-Rhodomonas_salina.1
MQVFSNDSSKVNSGVNSPLRGSKTEADGASRPTSTLDAAQLEQQLLQLQHGKTGESEEGSSPTRAAEDANDAGSEEAPVRKTAAETADTPPPSADLEKSAATPPPSAELADDADTSAEAAGITDALLADAEGPILPMEELEELEAGEAAQGNGSESQG